MDQSFVDRLAKELSLGSLLASLRALCGDYTLLEHWTQGEFHHDIVLKTPTRGVLVVATNCNGGVKEVLSFEDVPARGALWHWRCPTSDEFDGELAPVRARAVTQHWFDPCELLKPDARSELRPEYRERQPGGGWQMSANACEAKRS